jgi:serine/threonine protein kinase
MTAFKERLQELATGKTDLKALASSVSESARRSLVSAEKILSELDDAYKDNVIDFEAFSVLKNSVVTTIVGMNASARRQDFNLTVDASAEDVQTVESASNNATTNLAEEGGDEPIEVRLGMLLRGRFYVDEVLGKGGMGTVYKGRDLLKLEAQDRNPYIAIKVLNEDIKGRSDAFIALQREASRQQRLAHPNIATVYDFDRVGGLVFITMELLEGTSLDDYIAKEVVPRKGLPFDEALPIIRALGSGLSYAHSAHIIHSDFKPNNCFLTSAKEIKILDFGIARAVRKPGQEEHTVFDGRSLGAMTPSYASCEMLESLGDPHPSDDVYALACVAYELLTGKHPYNRLPANTAADLDLRPKPVSTLTKQQNRALARGVSFYRADRTPSADQFVEELAGDSDRRSTIWRLAGIVGLLSVLLLGGVFFLLQNKQSKLDAISEGIASGDSVAFQALLLQVDELETQLRQQVLSQSAAKDRITTFFEQDITTKAAARDFLGVDDSVTRARQFYNDSARVEIAFQSAVEQKNRILGELSETYERLLRTRKLLPDPTGNAIPNVIAELKKIDPHHSLITDARIASTYPRETDRLISKRDFAAAEAMLNTGDELAQASTALLNARDRLEKERLTAERNAQAERLELTLTDIVASASSLESFFPVASDLVALAELRPGSAVVKNARDTLGPLVESRLRALEREPKLDALKELDNALNGALTAIELDSLAQLVSEQHDTVAAQVEDLVNGTAGAIALGNLNSPPQQQRD